jgi:protocatechuate 3,4-dioxygenase beta subunit
MDVWMMEFNQFVEKPTLLAASTWLIPRGYEVQGSLVAWRSAARAGHCVIDPYARVALARPIQGFSRYIAGQGAGKMRVHLAAVLVLAVVPAAGAGELRGRILSENKPLGGVTVAALPFESPEAEARREARRQEEPKPVLTATTKPDGAFVLLLPAAAGVVRLRVSGGGARAVLLGRILDASEAEDLGDIPVEKTAVLAGRVVDGRGGPVVAATVTLRAGLWSSDESAPVDVVATTGADGTFKFSEAAETDNQIRVEAPAFATAKLSGLRAGAMPRPVALAPGRAVSGSVMLPDRRTPAAGALVRFEGRATTRWAEARRDGTFLVDGVPAEPGSLVADAGEKGRATAPAPESGAKALLVLAPTAGVRGRVVDASTAQPIAGIRVVARCGASTFTGRSAADGRYDVRGLVPGSCRLAADDVRYVPWSALFTVAAGETEAHDVPLVRGATLAGRVVDAEGRPLEGATGMVSDPRETSFRMFMRQGNPPFRSARDGTFKATRLAPGTNVRLTVRHDDFEARTLGGITLSGGATKSGLTVVLSRGLVVRGLVKDEDDRPVAGADVELLLHMRIQGGRRGAEVAEVGGGQYPEMTTGADGRFEFRGLTAGDYTLEASKKGMTSESIDPLKVAEGPAGEPVQIVLKAGSAISVTVRDKSGKGVAGWRVAARPQSQSGGGMGVRRLPGGDVPEATGPDGAFLIEGLTAGESYELQAMSQNLGPRKSGVVAPADVELLVSGKGRIRGTVVDADSGKPVPDFEVAYEPAGMGGMSMRFRMGGGRAPGDPMAVHSDDGSFVLEDVTAGQCDVQATASGYQTGRASGVTVDEGGSAEGVEVRLVRGRAVSGRVLENATGRPVIDATVRAELASGGGPRRMFAADDDGTVTTDAEGRFRIEGLASGSYTLTATHPEWTEETERVELKDQPATVEIRLGRGSAIGGAVLAAGRGVSGATVSLSGAGQGWRGPFGGRRTAMTDDAGRFRFDTLSPGRYTLLATLGNQSSAPAEAVLTGETSQEVTLVLSEGSEGATIRGTVSGLAENARGNVMVNANGPEQYGASTRTAGDGTFELTGAPKGPITLRANAGDFASSMRSATAQVVIAEGQLEAAVDIAFETGFRVEGQVTRGARPVTDAIVTAMPEGDPGRLSSSRTDEGGNYALEGLHEGTYGFVASSMPGGAAIRKTARVAGDMTLDLEAPPARIAGQVVEADSGRPLSEAMVRVEQSGGTGGGGGSPFAVMASADTDGAGRFLVDNLEPRSYRVRVTRPSYQTETRDIAATEDSEVTIQLRRGDGVGLLVRDGILATPLRGAFVHVIDAMGATAYMGMVNLDSDGRGDIPSFEAGRYEVRIGAAGYAGTVLRGVTVPSPPIAVALTPGGSVDIQSGPQTQAIPNAAGRFLDSAGAVYFPSTVSPDGLVRLSGPHRRIEHVAPGHYTFALDGGVRRELDVREGGSAVVTLP